MEARSRWKNVILVAVAGLLVTPLAEFEGGTNTRASALVVDAPPRAKKVSASLIPAYRPCNEANAAYCAGPVPPDPNVECMPPGPLGDCFDECRAACVAERWDTQCGFSATTGKGEITSRVVGGDTISLSAKVVGITGCESETLCLGFSSRQTAYDCGTPCSGPGCGEQCTAPIGLLDPTTLSPMREPDVVVDDIPPGSGSSCCVVRNGVCRFTRLLQRDPDTNMITVGTKSVTLGARTGGETLRASLWRSHRPGNQAPEGPTFVAGLAAGRPENGALLNGPKRAIGADGSLVEGYRTTDPDTGIEITPTRQTWGGMDAMGVLQPNDPKCRFGPNGSGKVRIRVKGTTATVKVTASGISCDAEGVKLCLSTSQQVTTTDCGTSSGPCTLVTVFDEPVGTVNQSMGCCTVTSSGRCRLRGDLQAAVPGAVKADHYYIGSFWGGGLQRITPIGGDDPLHDTLPAFTVGLFLP